MCRHFFLMVVFTFFLVACTPRIPFVSKGPDYPPRPPSPPPIETRVITLDQAQQQASFHLFVPTYLPSGFRILTVIRLDSPSDIPPTTRFHLEYIGPVPASRASPSFLFLSEEYWPPQPTLPGGIPPPPPYLTPPPKVSVHGVSVYVDKNLFGPSWFTPEPPDERYLALHWAESNVFLTLGGSLSLEELTRIAESLK